MIAELICAYIIKSNSPVSCIEAIAKLESNLNYKAREALGEIGLFQMRPKYFKTSWDLNRQIKLGIDALGTIKARCVRDLGQNWVACWNIGKSGALKLRGRKPGPYILKYIMLAKQTEIEFRRRYENLSYYSFNF